MPVEVPGLKTMEQVIAIFHNWAFAPQFWIFIQFLVLGKYCRIRQYHSEKQNNSFLPSNPIHNLTNDCRGEKIVAEQ